MILKNYVALFFLIFFISSSSALESIVHWQTQNGLKVYWVYSPSPAMVDIELLFAAGSAYDDKKSGLANATNAMFYEHAAGKDQAYWAGQIESLGAEIDFTARREGAGIRLRSLSEAEVLNEAVTLWLTIISQAEFREEDWLRVRKQLLSQLRDQQQDPSYLANQAFYQALFPNSPLSPPTLGSKESLMALEIKDLENFYQSFYHRNNAKLVIVGNIDKTAATVLAEKIAEALGEGQAAAPVFLPASQPQIKKLLFPSQQAHIILGYVTIARSHPDYYALLVANHLLGGNGFASRLMQKLRVDEGLTYGVHSALIPMQHGSIFSIRLQTRVAQSVQALELIDETLKNLRYKGFSGQEFTDTKENLVNSFPLEISSNRSILRQVGSIAFYDLELTRLAEFQDNIRAVSKEAVQAAIEKYFLPEALLKIQVGNFESLTKD